MDYLIRKAKLADLDVICGIYAYARKFMAEHGNPNQWGSEKPTRAELEGDIAAGNLYAVERFGRICGAFAFIVGDDPTYFAIYDGQWHHSLPYAAIHRVAGDGSGGILHACISYCEKQIPYLRIDTHHDNYVMQSALLKEGFRQCGIIYIADGTPRIAYDRLI